MLILFEAKVLLCPLFKFIHKKTIWISSKYLLSQHQLNRICVVEWKPRHKRFWGLFNLVSYSILSRKHFTATLNQLNQMKRKIFQFNWFECESRIRSAIFYTLLLLFFNITTICVVYVLSFLSRKYKIFKSIIDKQHNLIT